MTLKQLWHRLKERKMILPFSKKTNGLICKPLIGRISVTFWNIKKDHYSIIIKDSIQISHLIKLSRLSFGICKVTNVGCQLLFGQGIELGGENAEANSQREEKRRKSPSEAELTIIEALQIFGLKQGATKEQLQRQY